MGAIFCGYKYVNYVSKKTGKTVEGYSLYFTQVEKNVVGMSCFDCWVNPIDFKNSFADIPIGSEVSLNYNRYGSVSSCTIIKK